jgi:DNA-binding MarR family transcriptional regulator
MAETERPETMTASAPAPDLALYFAFFNEVGILNQLASAMFETRLQGGLLVSQFAVLNHLIRVKDGQTPLVLARAFQVPKTTMTHSLAVLERLGLIEVAPNPGDGRSKCVWITAAGRSVRAAAIGALAPDLAALAAGFDSARIAAVLPVLADLRRVMDALRDL